jgi:type II secretory pathway predicted ATPase ExeA
MSVDRLCAFYGFTRVPFGRDLPPASLFRSADHQEAVARLAWLIDERGLGILTGEVGAGKTVAARATAAALEPSRHQVVYFPNPTAGSVGLLSMLVSALGGNPYFHRFMLLPQAAEALATAETERGRRVVLIVDEAHLIAPHHLEDLRMLLTADMDSRSAAAMLLIGQPIRAVPNDHKPSRVDFFRSLSGKPDTIFLISTHRSTTPSARSGLTIPRSIP